MATTDGMPLLREKRGVDVVDEGGNIDELNGSRLENSTSQRSRRGAALALLVLAVGTVFAFSAMGGRSSPQGKFWMHPRGVEVLSAYRAHRESRRILIDHY